MEEKFHKTAKGQSYVLKIPAKGIPQVKWLFSFQFYIIIIGLHCVCHIANLLPK